MGGCCSKPPPPGVPILVQPIKNTHGAATVIETSTGPVPIHVPDTGRMFTAHLPEGSEPLPLNNSFGQTMTVHVPRGIGCRQAFVYHAPFASYALTVPEPYPPMAHFSGMRRHGRDRLATRRRRSLSRSRAACSRATTSNTTCPTGASRRCGARRRTRAATSSTTTRRRSRCRWRRRRRCNHPYRRCPSSRRCPWARLR